MLIEITYNVTDVFMSTTETPVYVEISFEQPGGSAAVWGSITGTLSNQTDLQNALNAKFDDPTGTTAQYIRGDGSLATFPALTGYVPYTGATTNVNLGEYELKAGQVTLDTSPTGTAAVGTIRWNDTTGTSETTLKGGNVIIKNGVDLVARVVNKVTPNTTLTKAAYQAVRVSGAQGQRLAVALAQANNDAGSADTIGLVTETIAPNQEGFIMTMGQLENINTTGSLQGETWVDGDVLYLSPTIAGAITNVKPTGAGHIVVIGYVEYAHQNNGKIYVKVLNGWELTELHDTEIVNPLNNEGLFYESSTALWKNKSISTVLGYTPEQPLTFNSPLSRSVNAVSIPQATGAVNGFLSATDWTTFNSKQAALGFTPANAATTLTINGVTFDLSANRSWTIAAGISGSGAAGQVTYWDGTSSVSGSNNLFWDAVNNALAIGGTTTNANYAIQVNSIKGIRINGSGGGFGYGIVRGSESTNITNNGAQTDFSSTNNISFSTSGSEAARFNNNRNFLIGTTTDNGQRLQVIGDTLLRGSGNTSATFALTVQNSDSTNMFRVRNDNFVFLQNIFPLSAASLNIYHRENIGSGIVFGPNAPTTLASGIRYTVVTNDNFFPASGNASYAVHLLQPTINQTGGANGFTRGLYILPTLTAAADWRSIQWDNNTGWGLYGAGSANNYLAGSLGIGSTALTGKTLVISKNITGSTIPDAVQNNGVIQSDVTNATNYFITGASTAAAAFTLPTLRHYIAVQGTFGAGSSVTNQYGYFAHGSMVGATNNYGFYGDIASGTGRWNLYMAGTADNYLGGNLGIGITPTVRLHVSGDTILRGSGATSATTALTVQNSSSVNLLSIKNDGDIVLGIRTGGIRPSLTIGPSFQGSLNFTTVVFANWNTTAYAVFTGIDPASSTFIFGGTSINASAKLQIDSNTSGFLPPRMTTTQKNAIATPAAGLVVYDTTLNKLCVYTTAWETITSI